MDFSFEDMILDMIIKDLRKLKRLVDTEDLSTEFAKLSYNDKKEIAFRIIFLEESRAKLDPETLKVVEEILARIQIINAKIVKGIASANECDLFAIYNCQRLFKNLSIAQNVLQKYMDDQIKNGVQKSSDNLLLMIPYFFNKVYNQEGLNAVLKAKGYINAPFEARLNDNTVFFDDGLRELLTDDCPTETFDYYLVYIVFALLHEFKHILDYNALKQKKDLESERMFKELIISQANEDFYLKNHGMFEFEANANLYGLNYTATLLEGVIAEKSIKEYLQEISKQMPATIFSEEKINKMYQSLLNTNPEEVGITMDTLFNGCTR